MYEIIIKVVTILRQTHPLLYLSKSHSVSLSSNFSQNHFLLHSTNPKNNNDTRTWMAYNNYDTFTGTTCTLYMDVHVHVHVHEQKS